MPNQIHLERNIGCASIPNIETSQNFGPSNYFPINNIPTSIIYFGRPNHGRTTLVKLGAH